MARLVVSAAVAVAVATVTGSPQAGFAAFSLTYGATGFLDPAQKVRGPKLDDLKGTTASYGTPIAHVYGHPRIAGSIVWCSDKITVENTVEQGGKGGPSTESTTYTYKINARFLLTANPIGGVRRVWSNGKLIWSIADDADAETLAASQETDAWERMTVYTGAADQMPDAVEEAALGIANCPAYRGRGSVFIEGLNLGGSGYLPNLTFEVTSESAAAELEYTYTGEDQFYVVPEGVTKLYVRAWGAGGGGSKVSSWPGIEAAGGNGGYAAGTIDVTPGETLKIVVGGGGAAGQAVAADGAYGGGGAQSTSTDAGSPESWSSGGGGGGMAAIMRGSTNLLAAGGGAGAGAANGEVIGDPQYGGAGGGTSGLPGAGTGADGNGGGGTQSAGGEGGTPSSGSNSAGGGDGTTGEGGGGAASGGGVTTNGSGGGGGGGYWGGGGGGASSVCGGGGGGGSSFGGTTSAGEGNEGGGVGVAGENGRLVIGGVLGLTCDPLADVLEDLCARSGIDASYVDFSSCAGQEVCALAVSQVTPARQIMQMLGDAFLQEFVESGDVLKTVARGGASVATLPYADLGASAGDPVEPLPLKRLNDIELPRQFAITYSNLLNDYQNGTEYSDRLLGGSTSVATTELPLGLEPQQAKRIADARLIDSVAGIIQIGPIGITRAYARLEPTDVITLTDHEGSTFRARIIKITDDGGLRTLELVQDDASAVTSSAVTDEGYESSSIVRANVATTLELIDGPQFRDADNVPHVMAAVTKSTADGLWPGAVLFRGVDDTAYSEVARFTDRTFIGETTTTLGAWTGDWVFDDLNSVTVSGVGTLVSYTEDAILNGTAAMYLVGNEVLFAKTATLVSTGVYTLSGLLRGRRGTDWAAASSKAAGTRVVLIQTNGLRRVNFESGQLGTAFDFRAVTMGSALSSAATESITPMGVSLKPWAPVHVEADDNGDGTYDVTWQRRTRMSCRFGGSLGINTPLGESSESYTVEVFDGASVTSTQTVSSESATVTADPGDVVRVYQVSATVGRGYVAELTL